MKKLFSAIIISILVVIAIPLIIGYYLSPRDKLEKSDAIVVVSGGETEARIKEGIWLYKNDYAPKIIFAGAAREGDVSNALAMKRIAVKSGIPSSSIIIEENSRDTEENAKNTTEIIKREGYKTIILSTSPYHQRRAYQNFKNNLPDLKIINWSAKDSKWRKFGWWKTEDGIRLTFSEILKITYTKTK